LTRIGREVRSWHLHRRTDLPFRELARRVNPKVAGWINYYGRFRPWELIPFVMRINAYLVRWIRKKYKRLSGKRKALAKLQEIAQRYPRMFAHWRLTPTVTAVLV
jgi:RNA-directed DNA polymerase